MLVTSRVSACLVIGAAVLGFCHGIKLANWQVAVEGAQVLSGLVNYPESSPQGVYYRKLWTLLNQVPALVLYLGAPERLLSVIISGLGGSAFYVGITLITYAVSRNQVVSLMMPYVVLWTEAAGVGGLTYPVLLMNSPHTYGSFGFSGVLIGIGLLGCGHLRVAGFVIGVLPSIHPSWGAWINTVLILSVLVNIGRFRWIVRQIFPWILFGYTITGISLLLWFVQSSGIDVQTTENIDRYIASFIQQWDVHRANLSVGDVDFRTGWDFHPVVLLTIFCIVWLAISSGDEQSPRRLLLVILVVSSVGASVVSGIVSVSTDAISNSLRLLMPNRWLNLSIVCFLPMLIGALGWQRQTTRMWMIPVGLTAIAVFKYLTEFPIPTLWFAACLIIYIGLLCNVAANGKQCQPRLYSLTIVLFLIPLLSASPAFLHLFSSGSTYFRSSVIFGCGVAIGALLLAYITDSFKYPRRWIIYSSVCLFFSGANLMLVPLFSPEWNDQEIYVNNFFQGAFVVVCALGIGIMRKGLLENGTRGIRAARQQIHEFNVALASRAGQIPRGKTEELLAITFVLAGCIYFLMVAFLDPAWGKIEFKDRTNSVFWEEVEDRKGLLLSGSNLYLVQLRSRRPVLLDGGSLDWLSYVPVVAPRVEKILAEIYGIDFFRPPSGASGGLGREFGRELWSERSELEWQTIRKRFYVTDVIVYDDWTLNLPLVIKGHGYSLYHIP